MKAAGRGGKMPLAQLADPWQKMAVESPSDSAEVSAARRPGPARPPLAPAGWLPFPELATWPLSLPLASPLAPGFLFGSLGLVCLPFCSSLPHPHFPSLARGAVVWWRVGFGVGAGALQEADFNQLCVGEAGGGVGAGEELGSLALPGWGFCGPRWL